MISRFNWFVGTLFLIAAFAALINPPFYIAIAIWFLLMGLVLLPPTESIEGYFNWHEGGVSTVILVSFILICLIVPQVETNPARFSTRPTDHLKDSI